MFSMDTELHQRTLALLDRMTRVMVTDSHHEGLKPAQWETLRYLNRANRFSRTPGALTFYLNVTKGTVSQTIKTLANRNLVSKKPAASDKRMVRLELTDAGRKMLDHDPLSRIEFAVAQLPEKTVRSLAAGMTALIEARNDIDQQHAFGICGYCRHFKRITQRGYPFHCQLLDESLTSRDAEMICVKYQPEHS